MVSIRTIVGSIALGVWVIVQSIALAGEIKSGEVKEYYDDGRLWYVSRYKEGKYNGLQQEYYPDGQIKQEANFVEGKKWGIQKEYYENGQLKNLMEYGENELLDGKRFAYLEDGTRLYEAQYVRGRLLDDQGKPYDGLRELHYPEGQLYSSVRYSDGYKNGHFSAYFPNGQVRAEGAFVQDREAGEFVEYFDSGKIKFREFYHDGLLHGRYESYYDNGQLQEIGEYREGKLNGEYKDFFSDGQLKSLVQYVDDRPTGQYVDYYPDGKVHSTYEYDGEGKVITEAHYDKTGKLIREGISFDVKGKMIPYLILWYAAFIVSLTIHEAAHAFSAYKLGDDTAYQAGQVTLNPLPHIRREFLGAVVVPLLTFISNGYMIGWGSAPYNRQWEYHYPRRSALMALAGPLSNLFLAALCMILMKVGLFFNIFAVPYDLYQYQIVSATYLGILPAVAAFLSILFYLNLALFVLNLIPVPPLDGSTVIMFFMSEDTARNYMAIVNQTGFMLVGLYAAWNCFGYLFRPVYRTAIQILYPGIDWGW